jgi:AraC-like DNA-binding protein
MILLQSTQRKDSAMSHEDAFFHYLPVSEETMSAGIYVTGGGRATIGPGEKYPPSGRPLLYQFEWSRGRTLPEFELILVTDGAGEFESEATGHVKIEGVALFIVFPGVWHRFRPSPTVGWTERWFSFNGELLDRLLHVGLVAPYIAVTLPRDPDRLVEEFDEMLDRIRDRSGGHPAVLAAQAMRIISDAVAQQVEDAIESAEAPASRQEDPIVQRALEIIWSHGPNSISVSDIARQLPVTRRTLDRRFVEVTGHSVLEEINTCRLSRAKRLLTETELPVKAVAHLAGFNSSERMRVLFIEREGTSPTAYRQNAAQAQAARRIPPPAGQPPNPRRLS